MSDNTDREAFERMCPVPEGLHWSSVDSDYAVDHDLINYGLQHEYRSKWQGFQLGRAQDAGFQSRVKPWMAECFGQEISDDASERNHRLLEESLELVQACGCTKSEAHQLVDYVYGRDVGQKEQEVGGVMVTLAALCLAQRIDMHDCGEIELTRIWTKVGAIRAKQAAKPKHSPLPQHAQHAQDADRKDAEIPWRCFHCHEVFIDPTCAAGHFGNYLHSDPACQIDIEKFRQMESDLHRWQLDDTDLHREIHGLNAKANVDVQRAEETGYARGLNDAKAHPETLGLVRIPAIDKSMGVTNEQARNLRLNVQQDGSWHMGDKATLSAHFQPKQEVERE